ncbi:MAG: ribonuclease H family protein [Lachnospiraceae bacterium]|nr:ribonuclease H family protein [Lachnospiraceae bacterium]
MAAGKKVYAVRKGLKTGIFETWDACKAAVTGYSGAEYKSFIKRSEAYEYLGVTVEVAEHIVEEAGMTEASEILSGECCPPVENPIDKEMVIAYVDGSYEHSILKYAFGCVFLLPDGRILTENGSGNNPESAKLRNVTGEMLGAMFAVRWAIKNGYKKIELRYDYEGVEKWVTGAWKSKTELTQKYSQAMRGWSTRIEMYFTKVAAHTNVYYNEMADKLAKAALEEKDGIPFVRMADEMEALS